MVANRPVHLFDILGQDVYAFDGKKICQLSDDKKECRKCWEAVSGSPIDGEFLYTEDRQKIKNQGPIPEGEYTMPSNKTDVVNKNKPGNFDIEGWNRNNDPFISLFHGSKRTEHRSVESWGNRFGPLTKHGDTNTFGRGNFYIHGGTGKGSAGCIDIGNNDIGFFETVRNDHKRVPEIHVIVDYSGKSTVACKCITVSPANWL